MGTGGFVILCGGKFEAVCVRVDSMREEAFTAKMQHSAGF